jgi:hypothetical protein
MKKLKIIEKAYRLNLDKIDDGFLCTERWCTAPNANIARGKLYADVKYEDMLMRFTVEPVTYFNLPVERYFERDTVLYKGENVIRHQVDYLIKRDLHQENLTALAKNKNVTHCYIKKHGSYYRDNARGYTTDITEAGIYTKVEAIKHANHCLDLILIPINIEEHNAKLLKHIATYQAKLL